MKSITFRELLELIHEGKAPIKVKYCEKWYQICASADDYRNESKLLSSVIGESHTLNLMAKYKLITIYDEILDDKEKEYLSNIIKPFKKYVKSITKANWFGQEQIEIRYKDFVDRHFHNVQSLMALPTFKAGTMYRGMELNKEYTLEELGI